MEPYKPCHCGANCDKYVDGNPNGCYGETSAYDEIEEENEWVYLHSCKNENHKDF